MADKNIFEFDTRPFEQGLNKISKGMSGLQKNAGNMAKNVARGVTSAIAKLGVLALAFKGVKSAIQEMPEIGKTFEIAKNVITKNLLFPLRKAVFPLLQKFLNWVRDNRAMFVRWGQTLANIFTTVVDSIGEMIEIGKRMFKTFLNFVNKIFGTNIKDLQDLFNILAFKFAVVFEFMKALISPVQNLLGIIFEIGVILIEKVLNTIFKIGAEFLKISKGGNNIFTVVGGIARLFGDILNFIIEMGSSLVNGFLPHLGPIFDSIKKISDAFQSIFDSIFGSNEAMKGWKSLFEFIGNVVGSTLQATFEVMADIVKGIDSTIKTIKGIINFLQGKEVGKDFGQNAFEALQGLFGLFNPVLAQQMKQLEPKKVQDAIITPEGKVIETAPDDFLIATKTPGRMSKGNVTINIDFKGMQLILQDAGPGEAQRFSETLVEKFREILSRELERQGI